MIPNYNPYQTMAPQPRYQFQDPNFLKGRPVTSIDEVRATPIDFDGSIFYFPDLTNNRIYTKQINMDGTPSFKVFEQRTLPLETAPTGNFVTYNSYFFNDVKLYNTIYKIPYQFYEQSIERIKMFNMLPFYIQKVTYYECSTVKTPYNLEENLEQLKKQLQYETYDKLSENDIILSQKFYITKQNEHNIIIFTLTLRKTIK